MVQPVTNQPKPDPTSEDLATQVEALKGDISRLTETLGDYGKSKQRQFSTEARRRAEYARGEAESRYDDMESYVRENPATAIGIAAGIGLLIGLLKR